MADIDVVIDEDGSIQMEVTGVKGPKCHDVTKQLEDAIGSKVASRPTADMYGGDGKVKELPEKVKRRQR